MDKQIMLAILITLSIGIIIGIVGRNLFEKGFRTVCKYVLQNLENFIMMGCGVAFILFVSLDMLKLAEGVSLAYMSTFSSIIFAWLLTKKSSELTVKKEQEKLAKLSHRHLGGVEKAILGLEQSIIDQLQVVTKMDNETQYLLNNLKSRIEYIKDGVKSNKQDWYDMLADDYKEELEQAKDPESINLNINFDLSELENIFEENAQSEEVNNAE